MSAKTTSYADSLLKLIFNATSYAGFAVNDTNVPFTNLYLSLHTAALTNASTQTTSETTYGGYTRVALGRTSTAWTITGTTVSPAATVTFPQSTTLETGTIQYFGIGTSSTGLASATSLIYFGQILPNILVSSSGITPELASTSTLTES